MLGVGGLSIALSIETGLTPAEDAVRLAAAAFHSFVLSHDSESDRSRIELGREAGRHLLLAARQISPRLVVEVESDLEKLAAIV